MTFATPSTSRDDFPYFETHNFDGWARQFRMMADSADNGCSIAFNPMPEPPTDEEGTPIPQTPLQVRALTSLQAKWKLQIVHSKLTWLEPPEETPQQKGFSRNRTGKMPETSMPL